MVFIAYDPKGKPISVVCAKDLQLARAYWQGKGVVAFSEACLEEDFTPIEEHSTGVFPLVETKERNIGDVFKPKNIIEVVNKG